MKELKIKLKKIWAEVTWKIRKAIMSKVCDMFLILDLRGNEQVDPLRFLLASDHFNNLIIENGYVIVQWKNSYFRIIEDYGDDDSFNYTYGEELSVYQVYLLGLYTRLDRRLMK